MTNCTVRSIRFVLVLTGDGKQIKGPDPIREIQYFYVDEHGRITHQDYEQYDRQGHNKWIKGGGYDYYCLSCKDEFPWWDDVLIHVAPDVPELTEPDYGESFAWTKEQQQRRINKGRG